MVAWPKSALVAVRGLQWENDTDGMLDDLEQRFRAATAPIPAPSYPVAAPPADDPGGAQWRSLDEQTSGWEEVPDDYRPEPTRTDANAPSGFRSLDEMTAHWPTPEPRPAAITPTNAPLRGTSASAPAGYAPGAPSAIPGPDLSPESGTPVRSAGEMDADRGVPDTSTWRGGGSPNPTAVPSGDHGPISNASRAEFVRTAFPYMLEAAGGDRNLAELMLAKAISENGSIGTGKPFWANNFSGIKGEGDAGSVEADTWEDYGNGPVHIRDKFAAYSTPQKGIAAFMQFLYDNSRYHPALERYRQTKDASQLFRDIRAAGYATDAEWASKVENIRRNQVSPITRGLALNAGAPEPASSGPSAPVSPAGAEGAPDIRSAEQAIRSGEPGVMLRTSTGGQPTDAPPVGSGWRSPIDDGEVRPPPPPGEEGEWVWNPANVYQPVDVRVPGEFPYDATDAEGADATGPTFDSRPYVPHPDEEPPPMMFRAPIGSGVPVRDRWATEPAPAPAPVDPDQGPREALPGSVGAQPATPPAPAPEPPSGLKPVWDAAGRVIGYVRDALTGGVSSASIAPPDAETPPPGSPYAPGQVESMTPPVSNQMRPGGRTVVTGTAELGPRVAYPLEPVTSTIGEPDYGPPRPTTPAPGGEPDYVPPSPSLFGEGGLLEPLGGAPRLVERMRQIRDNAARELGRPSWDQRVVYDPTWRANNPETAREYDDLANQLGLTVAGQAGDTPRIGRAAPDAGTVRPPTTAGRAPPDPGPQMLGSGVVPESRFGRVRSARGAKIAERAAQQFGVTDDPLRAGFVLPDGTLLDFGVREGMAPPGPGYFNPNRIEHERIGTVLPRSSAGRSMSAETRFNVETGSVRFGHDPDVSDVFFEVPATGITNAQRRFIARATRESGATSVAIDQYDPGTGAILTSDSFNPQMDRGAFNNFIATLGEELPPSTPAGAGVVPSRLPGLRADAYNAAQGGILGAVSEDMQAQAEGRESDPGERVRRAVTAGALAAAGGRYARRGPVQPGTRRLGSGVVGNEAMDAYTRTRVVPPSVADELDFPVRVPDDPRVIRAIEAAGGTVDPDKGVTIHVIRNQDPEAHGGVAVRGMPFYIAGPPGTPNPYARPAGGHGGTGGSERIEGWTRFRSPLVLPDEAGSQNGFDDAMRQLGLLTHENDNLRGLPMAHAGPSFDEVNRQLQAIYSRTPTGSAERFEAVKDLVSKYGGDPELIEPALTIRGAENEETYYGIRENILAANARKQGYDGVVVVQRADADEAMVSEHPQVIAAAKAVEKASAVADRASEAHTTLYQQAIYEELGLRPGETPQALRSRIGPQSQDVLDAARERAAQRPNVAKALDDWSRADNAVQDAEEAYSKVQDEVRAELEGGKITELADVREARNPTPGEPLGESFIDLNRKVQEARDDLYEVVQRGGSAEEVAAATARIKTLEDAWERALDTGTFTGPPGYALRSDVPRRGPIRESTIVENPRIVAAEQAIQDAHARGAKPEEFDALWEELWNARAEGDFKTARGMVPFDPASAALGAGAGAASPDEEGEQADPMRAAAGMAVAGIAGRRGRPSPSISRLGRRVMDVYARVTPQRVEASTARALQIATDAIAGKIPPRGGMTTQPGELVRSVHEAIVRNLADTKIVATGIRPGAIQAYLRGEGLTSKVDTRDLDKINEITRQQVNVAGGRAGQPYTVTEAADFAQRESEQMRMATGGTRFPDPVTGAVDEDAPRVLYGYVSEGQPLVGPNRPTVWLIWDDDTPRVTSAHHPYGLTSPSQDIHASMPPGLKAAIWADGAVRGGVAEPVAMQGGRLVPSPEGAPLVRNWERSGLSVGGGRKIAETNWLVGPEGEDAMRANGLIMGMPQAIQAAIARGQMADPEEIAAVLMRGGAPKWKGGWGAVMNPSRSESLILDPDISHVRALYITGTPENLAAKLTGGGKGKAAPNMTELEVAQRLRRDILEQVGRDVPILFNDVSRAAPSASQLKAGATMEGWRPNLISDAQVLEGPPLQLSPGRERIVDQYTQAVDPTTGRPYTNLGARVPFDPGAAAIGAGAGAASPDEEGEQADPMRTATGLVIGGILGRKRLSKAEREAWEKARKLAESRGKPSGLGNVPPSQIKEPTLPGMEAPYVKPALPDVSDVPNRPPVLGDVPPSQVNQGALPGMGAFEGPAPRPIGEVAEEIRAATERVIEQHPGVARALSGAERRAARMAATPDGPQPLSPLQWTRKLVGTIGYSSMIGPATASVNVFGNLLAPVWAIPKEAARSIARGNVREFTTMAAGAFRGIGQIGTALVDAIAARGRYASNPDNPHLSEQTINPIGHAVAAGLEFGGRIFSGMPDAIFGTVARSAGEYRRAAQIATDEGLKGKAWQQRVGTLLGEVEQHRAGQLTVFPQEIDDIITSGEQYADRQTFRDALGSWGKGASALAGRNIPVVGNLLTPFFNTPWNMGLALLEQSPAGLAMNRQRGFDKYYDAIAGTALITGIALGPAASGKITGSGPDDPEKRKMLEAEGWRPYHTLVGDTYVPNRVFGIYGKLLNAAGDIHDALAYQKKGATGRQITDDAARRFGNLIKEEPYLQGLSDILGMVGPNGAAGAIERYGASLATRMVPYGATARAIGTAQDPAERELDRDPNASMLESGAQRVRQGLGQRSDLPVAQDALGQPKANPQQGIGAVLPKTSPKVSQPLVRAYLDAGVDIGAPPDEVDGVKLTPAQQRRYRAVMGRELQRLAGPAVSGSTWASTPPATRKMLLETYQGVARTLAEVAVSAEGGQKFNEDRTKAVLDKALGR